MLARRARNAQCLAAARLREASGAVHTVRLRGEIIRATSGTSVTQYRATGAGQSESTSGTVHARSRARVWLERRLRAFVAGGRAVRAGEAAGAAQGAHGSTQAGGVATDRARLAAHLAGQWLCLAESALRAGGCIGGRAIGSSNTSGANGLRIRGGEGSDRAHGGVDGAARSHERAARRRRALGRARL